MFVRSGPFFDKLISKSSICLGLDNPSYENSDCRARGVLSERTLAQEISQ